MANKSITIFFGKTKLFALKNKYQTVPILNTHTHTHTHTHTQQDKSNPSNTLEPLLKSPHQRNTQHTWTAVQTDTHSINLQLPLDK